MKLNRHKPPSSLAFNMTPMIDIVFLLIIFFMTVSQITRTADVPLPLPRVTDGESDKINASITISLDKEGTIIIGSQKLSLAKAMTMVQTNLQK
ncbi:MAG: biopolymer transport protein ExbD, partial [Mariniblastus sp.]